VRMARAAARAAAACLAACCTRCQLRCAAAFRSKRLRSRGNGDLYNSSLSPLPHSLGDGRTDVTGRTEHGQLSEPYCLSSDLHRRPFNTVYVSLPTSNCIPCNMFSFLSCGQKAAWAAQGGRPSGGSITYLPFCASLLWLSLLLRITMFPLYLSAFFITSLLPVFQAKQWP